MIAPPLVDARNAADVVAQLRRLFRDDVPEWPRPRLDAWPAGDPGAALVAIFARLAEVTIERLNRAPEKHFLAFLEMLGVTLLPPAESRAPVQFFLAAGAKTDALVRRETPLATAEAKPKTFETEGDLWVSPARLTRTVVYAPDADRYDDRSAALTPAGLKPAAPFDAFVGLTLLDHILYLGHDAVLGIQKSAGVAVRFNLARSEDPESAAGVLSSLAWFTRTAGEPRRLRPARMMLGVPLPGTFSVRNGALVGSLTVTDVVADDFILIPLHGVAQVDTVAGVQIRVRGALPDGLPLGSFSVFRVDAHPLSGLVHTGGGPGRTVFGVGTSFTQEFEPGAELLVPDAGGSRIVAAIVSDTEIELTSDLSIAGTAGAPAWRRFRPLSAETTAVVELADVSNVDRWALPDGTAARWLWAKTETPLVASGSTFPDVLEVDLASASTAPQTPDRALANAATIDVAKGAFPFGERPRLGDAFYLASADVFSKTGARVTMTVNVEHPANSAAAARAVSLAWEFWSGSAWEELGVSTGGATAVPPGPYAFQDDSRAFTVQGANQISFLCPPGAPTQVAGQERTWIRARLAAGDYGEDARLTTLRTPPPPLTLADWTYQPPSFRPPFLSDVSLAYQYEHDGTAQAIAVRSGFSLEPVPLRAADSVPEEPFAAFAPPDPVPRALALGWDAAFSNNPISLFVAVAEQAQPPPGAEIRWQYWNGNDWAALGVIRDETKSLTESGVVQFLGPLDLVRSLQFGEDLYWIRAQLRQGDPLPYQIVGLSPNTTWARHAVTVRDELIGSSNGKPRQVFTASRTPVLPGQMLELRELEVPPADELAELAAEGETDPVRVVSDEAGRPRETWVRWHEVDHFQLSGPHSRHYVVDRARGRFVMGDGRRGRIPPPGRDNVRIAEYRAGGGQVGNVGPGVITVLKRAVPSIDRVDNPFAAGGGADLEDVEAVKDRGPLLLRHRNRAVTAEDYESLARQASRQVARAKCLSAHDAATAGKVSLLIVPSGGPRPLPTPGLLRRVKSYLDARRMPTADLSLFGPNYVDVAVTTQVVPRSFDDADLVRQRVADVLTAWLHPLTGGPNGTGWPFGRDVFLSEVAATIEAIDGIDHVARLALQGTAGGEDRTRDGGRRVDVREDAGELVASGLHTVTLAT